MPVHGSTIRNGIAVVQAAALHPVSEQGQLVVGDTSRSSVITWICFKDQPAA